MPDLVTRRPQGLYCEPGGFYIDPWLPVDRAVITHAHADHCRPGHAAYLAHRDGLGLMRSRLGEEAMLEGLAYGEARRIGDVSLSLHPAGHVLGSAQVRIEHGGEVWVVAGDYFVSGAGDCNTTCAPFEPVRCNVFVTESTFGLPIYRWAQQTEVLAEMRAWWADCAAQGKHALLMGYSLGKAQRLIAGLATADAPGPVLVHGAVARLNTAYREAGVALPEVGTVTPETNFKALRGALVIAPPALQDSRWAKAMGPHSDAFASGWMRLRGARRRRSVDRGFVFSDHADWPGLLSAIAATGAQRVIVTHGDEGALVRCLTESGLQAEAFATEYGDETHGGAETTGGMKRFVALYLAIDASTSTLAKVAALKRYLADAPARDAAWAVYLLAGGTPRRAVSTSELRALACEAAALPEWLFEAGYAATGDLAEAIAYVLPDPEDKLDEPLADWMEQRILPLRALDAAARREAVLAAWRGLSADERFMFVKLVGGGFRVGVSKLLVQRALAEWSGADAAGVAQRMMGYTSIDTPPTTERFQALLIEDASGSRGGQPYPFFLAHALPGEPAALGARGDWLAEWKYDGIRAQVVKRDGQVWIWSRGEELVTERFPEVVAAASTWPDGTVVDGELLAWLPGETEPAPFALLQKRIGRTKLSKAILAEAPVRLLAYDLLESEGVDRRPEPMHVRRARLEQLGIATSPLVDADEWAGLASARELSRERRVEGLMLKHRESAYGIGRTVGAWWKWKVAPLSVDAVLIYAQAGHGRRANLYTDYSFAVWNRAPRDAAEAEAALDATGGELTLVPFAKAYSGLTDEEIKGVDRVIRKTTTEKFGPVRRVRPSMVFELGFEGIQASTRHKSGIAVRFPRMLRIRDDKPLHEADTLDSLRALMEIAPNAGEDLADE